MPPLSHSLTETETSQTPLIPVGSFTQFPDFANKIKDVLSLVDPADREKISREQNELVQKKAHLTALLEDLKASQKDYDFSDYEERLLLSDAEIENILETEIFRNGGEFSEIGKIFYEYLEMVTVSKSEEMKGRMKRKLVSEFGLVDRVYERNIKIGGIQKCRIRIGFINKEQFFRNIQNLHNSWIESLDLSYNKLSWELDASDLIILVQQAGFSGIKSLALWDNSLYEILDTSEIITLVQQAGFSGIKSLALWDNKLSWELDASDLIILVQQAGFSGIKSLDIWYNHLYKKLDATDLITLIQQAGFSGIKSLRLWGNSLCDMLDASEIITLVQQAGFSGIKSLALWENSLYEILDASDIIKLVQQAGFSGIKSLDISYNDFRKKLGAPQKRQLDSIAKQFDMELDYSY